MRLVVTEVQWSDSEPPGDDVAELHECMRQNGLQLTVRGLELRGLSLRCADWSLELLKAFVLYEPEGTRLVLHLGGFSTYPLEIKCDLDEIGWRLEPDD